MSTNPDPSYDVFLTFKLKVRLKSQKQQLKKSDLLKLYRDLVLNFSEKLQSHLEIDLENDIK